MARLFIFAIGGTGSRVLKSLTMLLASGVKPNSDKEFEIVPIIIDPHESNGDKQRTESMLSSYQEIVYKVGLNNGFWSTAIKTLDKKDKDSDWLNGSFTFNLQDVANKRFKDYINLSQLDESNKGLSDILFSGKSIDKNDNEIDLLDVEMDIGFVGNPNIGSVVLNQFKDSKEFIEVASSFNEDDRIFIISSIFGGTGAAGFPTILKNIRNVKNSESTPSKGFLQNAKIGAITVLPYFNVETKTKSGKKSPIQKSDFIAKTKSALRYYSENVTGNNSVNCMYYIGDDYIGKAYKNDPGKGRQINDAHFIELASALAIVDFLEINDDDLKCKEGKAIRPIYKGFNTISKANTLLFSGLKDDTQKKIGLRLTQFLLFNKYLKIHLESALKEAWATEQPSIDNSFLQRNFYKTHLSEFMKFFEEWLKEMSTNERAFSPYNIEAELSSIIKDRSPEKGWFKSKVDFALYDTLLAREAKGKSYSSKEIKFIKLFNDVTKKLLEEKFRFN